jgi:hypothetical protein
MCSYNLICVGCKSGQIGNWSCENDATLRVDLKERLNFSECRRMRGVCMDHGPGAGAAPQLIPSGWPCT